jgi:hypothetical protein
MGQARTLNEGRNSNSANASAIMPDSCQTDTSGGHASSNSCVNTSNVNDHVNGGPQIKCVNEVGIEGSLKSCSLNNIPK